MPITRVLLTWYSPCSHLGLPLAGAGVLTASAQVASKHLVHWEAVSCPHQLQHSHGEGQLCNYLAHFGFDNCTSTFVVNIRIPQQDEFRCFLLMYRNENIPSYKANVILLFYTFNIWLRWTNNELFSAVYSLHSNHYLIHHILMWPWWSLTSDNDYLCDNIERVAPSTPHLHLEIISATQCFKKFHPKVRNHGEGPY